MVMELNYTGKMDGMALQEHMGSVWSGTLIKRIAKALAGDRTVDKAMKRVFPISSSIDLVAAEDFERMQRTRANQHFRRAAIYLTSEASWPTSSSIQLLYVATESESLSPYKATKLVYDSCLSTTVLLK